MAHQNPKARHRTTKARNRKRPPARTGRAGREGATETQVGDRGGPGPGYDKEPEQTRDKAGVTPS
jgi:hypothetical protein